MTYSHDELAELLGAYALDAVDGEEVQILERHLEGCPRCRAELVGHREVAGLLGFAGQEAPAGVWDRIVTSMQEPPPALRLERADMAQLSVARNVDMALDAEAARGADPFGNDASRPLTAVGPDAGPPPAMGYLAGRRRRRQPGGPAPARRAVRARTLAVLAAAAVVAVAVLGVQTVRLDHKTSRMNNEIVASAMNAGPSMSDVRRALGTQGARNVVLTSLNGGTASLEAVILPSGQGYVYDDKLTPLQGGMTYQLWGIKGAERVSYGPLGGTPDHVEAFEADATVQALAVTAEVAGGVTASTNAPVALGSLPDAVS